MSRCTNTGTVQVNLSPEIGLLVVLICVVILSTSVSVYFWRCDKEMSVEHKCTVEDSVIVENVTLLQDKSLRTADGEIYPEGYYKYDNHIFRACTCTLKPCIRKCCPPDQAYSSKTIKCTPRNYSSPFHPLQKNVYKDIDNLKKPINISEDHFNMIYGELCLEYRTLLSPDNPDDVNYLLTDGKLINGKNVFSHNQYCFESFIEDSRLFAVPCIQLPKDDLYTTLYPIGEIISLPCLMLTFIVYAIIPDLQNLHGLSLMCHVGSLFVAYLSLVINQQAFLDIGDMCLPIAFIIQFSFLSSFFWLNIMCFDIWWVFSGLRPLRGSVKEREHKKFIIYSIYAWGCPLVIFIITLVMQTVEDIPDTYSKPEFGKERCWFRTKMATFLYFYLPIIVLVVLNIIMFITTAFRLLAHTKETAVLKNGESRRHDENERQRFNLYLKLFIVMGVNWVMELVSWLAEGPKYLWYVTDLTNTLQGVLIFLIFVWKRRILRLLNEKLCPSLQLVPNTTSSTRSKVSPSRTTSSSLKQTSSNNMNPAPDSISLKKIVTSDDSDVPV